MSKGPFLRKYGVATTILIDLFEVDGVNMQTTGVTFAAADTKIMKDEGAEANTGSTPVDEGSTYSLALTATEMTAARIKIILIDSATKLWLDTSVSIETYGHRLAQHAFDLDKALVNRVPLPPIDIKLHIDQIVKAVWDRILTGSTHNIQNSAGRRLRTLQESGGVYNGRVWIDTLNGTAGTTSYENGTSDNHVLSFADAKTILAAVGLSDFHIINGSTITLDATMDNRSFFGDNWILALGGQQTANAHFEGASVSGVQTGTGAGFHGGEMGDVTLDDDFHIDKVGLKGTITLPAGTVELESCHMAGPASFDFGAAIGNTTVHCHQYGGRIEVQNMGDVGTDILNLDSHGKLEINANCSGGTINLRGSWEVIDNANNAVMVNYDDVADDVSGLGGSPMRGTDGANQFRPQSLAAIKAVILEIFSTDIITLPGQGAPSNTPTLSDAIGWLYKNFRNRKDQTLSLWQLYADDQTTVDSKATISDDATTTVKQEIESGP